MSGRADKADKADEAVVIAFPRRADAGPEPLLDKRRLARALGRSVSWVEKHTSQVPGFPLYRVGARRLYRLSEVQAWLCERDGGR
jgi:hypothetical protein